MHTLFILADNQDITREGVHAYLSRLYPMSPTRNVTGKKELLTTLTLPYSRMVVILDYPLFDLKDVEELLVIVKRFPSTIWILFSSELSENIIRRVGAEPTIGILLKECPGEEIRKALQEAAEGRRYLCAQVSNLLQGNRDSQTYRQRKKRQRNSGYPVFQRTYHHDTQEKHFPETGSEQCV